VEDISNRVREKLSANHRKENGTNDTTGVCAFDPSAIRVGLVAGAVGLLLIGSLGIATIRERTMDSRSLIACLLLSLGLIAFLVHGVKLSGRSLQISDDSIAVRDKLGNEMGALRWVDLGRVTEGRKMAQFALWDKAGKRRVFVDQQFENFNAIRARILAEYAKVFILKPLPTEFPPRKSSAI
jgi:hypothetical protein